MDTAYQAGGTGFCLCPGTTRFDLVSELVSPEGLGGNDIPSRSSTELVSIAFDVLRSGVDPEVLRIR